MYILLFIMSAITACGMTMHFLMGNFVEGIMGLDFLLVMCITYHLGQRQDAKWFSDVEYPIWFRSAIVLPTLGIMAINTFFKVYDSPNAFSKYGGFFFVIVLIITMITSYYDIYKEIRGNKND